MSDFGDEVIDKDDLVASKWIGDVGLAEMIGCLLNLQHSHLLKGVLGRYVPWPKPCTCS